jgi:hypothetical protein
MEEVLPLDISNGSCNCSLFDGMRWRKFYSEGRAYWNIDPCEQLDPCLRTSCRGELKGIAILNKV